MDHFRNPRNVGEVENEERWIELTETEKFEALKRMELATEKYGIEFDGEWKFAAGTTMNFGSYYKEFWQNLTDGQSAGYNR